MACLTIRMLHPRLWGTFQRCAGLPSREEKLFSLPEAIHKMTGMPAQTIRAESAGLIRKGYAADLVLFAPETIHSTRRAFSDPDTPIGGDNRVCGSTVYFLILPKERHWESCGTLSRLAARQSGFSKTLDLPDVFSKLKTRLRKGDSMILSAMVLKEAKGTGGQHLPFARAVEADRLVDMCRRFRWLTVRQYGQISSLNPTQAIHNSPVDSQRGQLWA